MKPYLIAAISGIILIAVGVYSFLSNDARPLTALIGPAIGVFFLASAPAIKKDNRTIAHLVVVLTLVFAVTTAYMAYQSVGLEPSPERERRIQVFSAMAITCIGAFAYYIQSFIERKRKESEIN